MAECGEKSHGCREASSIEPKEENANYSCALISERSPQLLSSSAISEISSPNFVYMRRKLKRNSAGILSAQLPASVEKCAEESLSVISSDTPSVAVKEQHVSAPGERKTEGAGTPVLCYQEYNRKAHNLKSESFNACPFIEDISSDEASKSSKQKFVEVESINESCSSSKSNMELVSASSMKAEPDDTCECSSSSVMIPEVVGADASEKDLCVSILRSQGLIQTVSSGRTIATAELDDTGGTSTSRSCKICTRAESAQKMLVCDNCEDAFHLSCCNPRVKRIPIDEWFCHSCLKKCKILTEAVSRSSPNIMGEMSRYKNVSAASESSPIALMLTDNGPYITGVRVGKGFQAEVPDWSGPSNNVALLTACEAKNADYFHSKRFECDFDTIGEPLEMDPSEFVGLHELKFNKPSMCGPIGNWLQCREVIDYVGDGVGGTACGKWRRAPLFEVQTDGWSCCCSVIWDPIHADCAVPQEVDTDEVLKQLKYIQVLRPRMAAKRQKKLDRSIIGLSLKNTEKGGYKSRGTSR